MATTKGPSLAEFAGLYGKTKQAAAKWKAKGWLIMTDGQIDAGRSKVALAERGVLQIGETSTARQPPSTEPAADLDVIVQDADAFIRRVLGGDYSSFADAEKIKENALALKHVLDGREKAGRLVEVEVSQSVLFECAREYRDALLNWPVRVGPLIAADLGLPADRVTEVLTGYVNKHLAELADPEANFKS